MELIDFTRAERSYRHYGGSERKLGILFDGCAYMLKFRKKTNTGFRFNVISEFIGSHVFELLGFNVQKTLLGRYEDELVVACKDFLPAGATFTPFNAVGESSLDTGELSTPYSYEGIVALLRANVKLTDISETISTFFDIFIVDALLGNFDRHGLNWGFIKRGENYVLSPVFDNGSCLFPNMICEEEMLRALNMPDEIRKRTVCFPTSQIKLDSEKSSYHEVISSCRFPLINDALIRVFPRINLTAIFELIDSIPVISQLRKRFYKVILKSRYDLILKDPYGKLMEGKA